MNDPRVDSSGQPPSAGADDSSLVGADSSLLPIAEGSCRVLRLYVSGNTRRSTLAIQTLKQVCERYLPGGYALEIIDIYSHPIAAKEAQIIAVPTLLKLHPEPRRLLIGDLSDTHKLLRALDIQEPLP